MWIYQQHSISLLSASTTTMKLSPICHKSDAIYNFSLVEAEAYDVFAIVKNISSISGPKCSMVCIKSIWTKVFRSLSPLGRAICISQTLCRLDPMAKIIVSHGNWRYFYLNALTFCTESLVEVNTIESAPPTNRQKGSIVVLSDGLNNAPHIVMVGFRIAKVKLLHFLLAGYFVTKLYLPVYWERLISLQEPPQ